MAMRGVQLRIPEALAEIAQSEDLLTDEGFEWLLWSMIHTRRGGRRAAAEDAAGASGGLAATQREGGAQRS
jgi:hypothetical protein